MHKMNALPIVSFNISKIEGSKKQFNEIETDRQLLFPFCIFAFVFCSVAC